MTKARVLAVVVFLVFFSSVIVNAQLTSADSVFVPELQKSIEKKPVAQNSVGVVSRAFIKTTIARS
jgi:hypothetical protein